MDSVRWLARSSMPAQKRWSVRSWSALMGSAGQDGAAGDALAEFEGGGISKSSGSERRGRTPCPCHGRRGRGRLGQRA